MTRRNVRSTVMGLRTAPFLVKAYARNSGTAAMRAFCQTSGLDSDDVQARKTANSDSPVPC